MQTAHVLLLLADFHFLLLVYARTSGYNQSAIGKANEGKMIII